MTSDVRALADAGYSYDEIVEELEDQGFDAEDIAEAFVDTGYDWEEATLDAIRDNAIDLDDAAYYADLLSLDISDVYDIYYGYEDD